MEKLSVGEKIRDLRVAKGMTQEALAQISMIASATLNRIENEHHKPTRATIKCIADALGVDIGFLYE